MTLKTTLTLLLSVFTLGAVGPAAAHSISNKTLRPAFGASATDIWQATCGAGSSHMFAQIRDQSADNNLVSLVVVSGVRGSTTTDLIGGDQTFSPGITVAAGNATYTMLVNHTRAGGQVYSIEYHCENASGGHTETTTPTAESQNQ
ncbi:hypothetical protein [Methylicorpusculum sp.]|uniref:hypothetical protein n=1 Tax=Methylicorpusculum sp. TaxID=2713644 RepID=UPI00272FE1F7|nr:hypothetical protein [Methylicorpusculum sp.]MDP2180385.1 hypothetical protein [Methylicorpusculum sp.]MDP3527919.1 hypothetical protein [Methylicorpusculum sp.]MDZ4150844.1 hypothetical protein [Methylicorpusculum sp.]